jgi:ubiquinone/menaquinone biosynthesis C-methylase UbiE
MKQKDVFLQSEGDAWHERNHGAVDAFDYRRDPVAIAIAELAATQFAGKPAPALLEVGCGEAKRLQWLAQNTACVAAGLDPSARAIEGARARGVNAVVGTADALPYSSASIDILLFGFCLCMCDREDLFRISSEADRVLKAQAWLVIADFFAPSPIEHAYHHREGVRTFKMDYRTLFSWHPRYECFSHRVFHHSEGGFTDDPQEWVAISVMRKFSAHG